MPIYETQASIKAEKEIIDTFCARYGASAVKLSAVNYRLDWGIFIDGRLVAYAEVKDRDIRFGQYSGMYISAAKIAHGRVLAKSAKCAFHLIIRCTTDGVIAFANCGEDDGVDLGPIVLGGRTDRGTLGDIEPVHDIPWSSFWKLG